MIQYPRTVITTYCYDQIGLIAKVILPDGTEQPYVKPEPESVAEVEAADAETEEKGTDEAV